MSVDAPVVSVTEPAREVVLGLRAAEDGGDQLALRLDVVGQTATEYAYELAFEPLDGVGDGDVLVHSGELPVVVPSDAVDKLRGAVLDHSEAAGLVLRNPNRPRPEVVAAAELELTGSVEERIQQLLDGEVNPSLAMHGGFARLERVEGDQAFLVMGGGCQGCGLAALTLTEGIKASIEKHIPEIREVVDVTDHAAGENPFYEPGVK